MCIVKNTNSSSKPSYLEKKIAYMDGATDRMIKMLIASGRLDNLENARLNIDDLKDLTKDLQEEAM